MAQHSVWYARAAPKQGAGPSLPLGLGQQGNTVLAINTPLLDSSPWNLPADPGIGGLCSSSRAGTGTR